MSADTARRAAQAARQRTRFETWFATAFPPTPQPRAISVQEGLWMAWQAAVSNRKLYPHGTYSGHRRGCRCTPCMEAQRAYFKHRRDALKQKRARTEALNPAPLLASSGVAAEDAFTKPRR